MCNTNNILFRVDDNLYAQMSKIKTSYKFRSNAELAKTIVNIFCNVYGQKKRKEETIEDIFKELEDGELMFEFVEENERQFRIGNLKQNLSPAILSYEGIQYKYMAPAVFEEQAFTWLEKHLRILSGFYGALSPFDGVIPYRLEMRARFHKEEIDNLYDFWGQKLADYVLKDCDCLINLASKEYSKSILKYIPENVRVITCVFGELIDGKIKEKGTYAKMARGSLVRYMAEHQIENPEEIKQFDELGYKYKEEYSNSTKYCYLIR